MIAFKDYIQLVEWTGKTIRDDKKGCIPAHIAPVLEKLQLNPANWTNTVKHFDNKFFYMVGQLNDLIKATSDTGRQWCKGKTASLLMYKPVEPPTQV